MNVAKRFGANLVRLRRQAGLTQSDLAACASMHRTEISLLERGLRCLRIDTVAKLAAALWLDPCALLEGMAPRPPGQSRRP